MEKENYLKRGKKELCTACGACKQVCPKDCIRMKEDNEGFKYPLIDKNKCINCEKCNKVCPISNEIKTDLLKVKLVFGYRLDNKKLLLSSSSGGAFTSIVQTFCDKNYVIFGAKFDEKLNVVHDFETDKNNIQKFRKSKYVQSDIKDSYKYVQRFLKNGYKVLFSGTPCQIAGLKMYLNKDYERLLLIEVICHGVPSQKVFNKYLQYESEKYNLKVKEINFREKVKEKQKWNSRNLKLKFENDKTIIENSNKNLYLKGFHKGLFYRPSCYNCKYATRRRYADITIADSWGIENIDKNLDVHEGLSLVIINTEKGKKYFDFNKDSVIKLDEQFVVENNAQYTKPTKIHKKRQYFFKNIDKIAFNKLINRCTNPSLFRKIIYKIKRLLI